MQIKELLVNLTIYLEIDETREIDITDSFVKQDYKYLKKSKRTILIFKRTYQKNGKSNIELRHQRTCDVCFDWAKLDSQYQKNDTVLAKTKKKGSGQSESAIINNDGLVRDDRFRPQTFMYKMIETMLPKASLNE